MPAIIPHLWFDTEAKEAAEFYATVFPNSKVNSVNVLKDTPSGDCDVVSFQIRGQEFAAISAGPIFKFTPAISFMVNFDPSREKNAKEDIDVVWAKLKEGGKVLMEIGKYPFSERYGWIQDKFGLSWQLILTNPEGEPRPEIVPTFLFTDTSYGKAEEAVKFWLSVFKESKMGTMMKYPAGDPQAKEGTVMFSDFKLLNLWLAAMDGPGTHNFAFTEAVSFMVNCDTQEEINYFWEKLSAVPEAEQCGWLKDKFGVSWQVVPAGMDEFLTNSDPVKAKRAMQAMLQMKKFDIKKLEDASEGK